MSGGIAFVYDADGTFASRCNQEMVDLKPLHEKSVLELRLMLQRHAQYTDSPVARRMLDNWDDEARRFIRVMPRDYARVLAERTANTECKTV
jgi:glutamate synthase domain-containing protein 3